MVAANSGPAEVLSLAPRKVQPVDERDDDLFEEEPLELFEQDGPDLFGGFDEPVADKADEPGVGPPHRRASGRRPAAERRQPAGRGGPASPL